MALRALCKSHSESCEQLLGSAKLPTLYNRRLQDTTVMMYKITYGLTPTCISDLIIAMANKAIGKHSIEYLGPFSWSGLKGLKESPNVITFRNKSKKTNFRVI